MSSTMSHHDHGAGGHETQDFTYKNILWVIPFSIVLLVIYVAICMYGYQGASTKERIAKQSILADTTLIPFKAHEAELLHGYSWADKEAGTVRIPIDIAMQKVIEDYNQTASTPQPQTHK